MSASVEALEVRRFAWILGSSAGLFLALLLAWTLIPLAGAQQAWILALTRARHAALLDQLAALGREAYLPEADQFFLSYVAARTLEQKDALAVSFLGPDGRLLLFRRKALGAAADPALLSRSIRLPGGRLVGSVRVHFSTLPARATLRLARLGLLWAGLGAALAGALLIAWGLPLLLDPVRRLSLSARTGRLDAERLRATFSRYVSPPAAREILRLPGPLGGEEREVTVLLCDIRNFTSLAEGLPPVAVFLFLNEFFSRIVAIIHKREGVVNKYIGDAVLALFGAPVPSADHASRATFCALEIRRAVREYNRDREEIGQPPIRVGIALHTGRALAGSVGTPERAEYTVIGDTVNLVSRLEELNKRLGTDILLSSATQLSLNDGFRFRTWGEHSVRGRREPVEVYELVEAAHA